MGLLTPCIVPREGRVFAPFKSCPGGMVMDEIDTCIITKPKTYTMKAYHKTLSVPENEKNNSKNNSFRNQVH